VALPPSTLLLDAAEVLPTDSTSESVLNYQWWLPPHLLLSTWRAHPGAAAVAVTGPPPSASSPSSGPLSPHQGCAPPGASSAVTSGPLHPAPGPSFKEVASRQGNLHATTPEVTSRQGRPSGLHATVLDAPTVSIQMPQEALTHARHYNKHALVCRFNGFWPNLPNLLSWISSDWYPLLDGEIITCPCAKGFFCGSFRIYK
jgi:hypothetical protein